jgi:hypothetical protein
MPTKFAWRKTDAGTASRPMNQVKDWPTSTKHPNALPASWRCPGQPADVVWNFFQFSTSGSPSVMAATIPTMKVQ